MYCTKLDIHGLNRYPLLLGSLYEGIAQGYALPSLEILLKSLKADVTWPTENILQVYYLDNLMEPSKKDVFQVRFATAPNSRELTSLFLSVENSQIMNISVQFPGRSGRGAFSRILALMKSVAHTLNLDARDIQFEAQGFRETGFATYLKEQSLSAFIWIDPLGRYLHIKEDPNLITEVRKRMVDL